MAYEVKFLEIGSKIKVLVNNGTANLNQWYSISDIIKVAKKDSKLVGEPFDSIKYISRDGSIISNEALIQINYPPSKKVDPKSTNSKVEIFNNIEYKMIDYIGYNNAVDRLRITKLETEAGYLTYKGVKVYLNQEIMLYDLDKLIFVSKNGIGSPYQKIYFQVGNIEKYSEVYSLEFAINGKCFINQPIISKGTSVVSSAITNKIENGVPGGTAKITVLVETNSAKVFDDNTSITINDVEIVKTGLHSFDVKLDSDGEYNFNIYIFSEDTIDDGAIFFDLELKLINNDDSFIDKEKNKSSIIINL